LLGRKFLKEVVVACDGLHALPVLLGHPDEHFGLFVIVLTSATAHFFFLQVRKERAVLIDEGFWILEQIEAPWWYFSLRVLFPQLFTDDLPGFFVDDLYVV